MFAMLNGALPRVSAEGLDLGAMEVEVAAGRLEAATAARAADGLVREVVTVQVEAGLGLVTDGQVRWADPAAALLRAIEIGDTGSDGFLVRAWRATAAEAAEVAEAADAADAAAAPGAAAATAGGVSAAQAFRGPYSLGRLGQRAGAGPRERTDRTLALAATLAGELSALAAAGCRVVIVEEPASTGIGEDDGEDGGERDLFARAQRRLLADVAATPELHAMLAVTGGPATGAGPGAVFAAPYSSYLFDLIAGPDNWTLVRAAPPACGIVCAALQVVGGRTRDQAPELVWAARYAASSGDRGIDRVGLANATPLGTLDAHAARAALVALGRAARLAGMAPADAVAAGLDPRTFRSGPAGSKLPRR